MAKVSFITTVGRLSAMIRSEVMLFVGKTDAVRNKWIVSLRKQILCFILSFMGPRLHRPINAYTY